MPDKINAVMNASGFTSLAMSFEATYLYKKIETGLRNSNHIITINLYGDNGNMPIRMSFLKGFFDSTRSGITYFTVTELYSEILYRQIGAASYLLDLLPKLLKTHLNLHTNAILLTPEPLIKDANGVTQQPYESDYFKEKDMLVSFYRKRGFEFIDGALLEGNYDTLMVKLL